MSKETGKSRGRSQRKKGKKRKGVLSSEELEENWLPLTEDVDDDGNDSCMYCNLAVMHQLEMNGQFA